MFYVILPCAAPVDPVLQKILKAVESYINTNKSLPLKQKKEIPETLQRLQLCTDTTFAEKGLCIPHQSVPSP